MTKNSGNTDIILSRTMRVTCTDQDSNVLLVGESGPGISSYIASNILQAHEVYVAADPGGALYRQYGGFLKNMGYRVRCLDLINPAEGDRYNPFRYIRNDEDIIKIAEILISEAGGTLKPPTILEKQARPLLEALIAYVQYHVPEDKRTFLSVIELLRKCEEKTSEGTSALDRAFEEAEKTAPESFAVNRYKYFKTEVNNIENKRWEKSMLLSCAVLLQIFTFFDIEKLITTDDIGLDSLWDKKTALFITTPIENNVFNAIAKILYSQLFDIIDRYCCSSTDSVRVAEVHNGIRPLPIYTKIFLDSRSGLPCLDGVLFKNGKRRLSVSVAVRDSKQIKGTCGRIWEEISEVFDTMIFLSDGRSEKRSFITLAFGDRRIPSHSNGTPDSEDDRSRWVDEMFCGLAEDECLIAVFTQGVGTARKDRRYVVSEHPNWSIAEQSMREGN